MYALIQVLSARWMLSEDRHKNMSRRKLWLVSLVHVLGGGIIWRYSLLFAPIQVSLNQTSLGLDKKVSKLSSSIRG
jgi:XK-related protein